jgi:hypothetical protein
VASRFVTGSSPREAAEPVLLLRAVRDAEQKPVLGVERKLDFCFGPSETRSRSRFSASSASLTTGRG